MAKIKCRYTIPYCDHYSNHSRTRIYHDEYWSCRDNENCPTEGYTKPYMPDESPEPKRKRICNPTCQYCKFVYGEFEKTVRSYEYSDGTLWIGKNDYCDNEIEYLEIDGRVLVDG